MLKVDFVALTTALHHLQLLAKALRDVVLHLLAERRVHKLKRESVEACARTAPPFLVSVAAKKALSDPASRPGYSCSLRRGCPALDGSERRDAEEKVLPQRRVRGRPVASVLR